jgi:hypothetical protein
VLEKDGRKIAVPVSYITSLDTGGYTGSWDASGRLAVLH